MTAREAMDRARLAGYRLSVRDDRLDIRGPRGSEVDARILRDLRDNLREVRIYAAVEEHRRNPRRCELCRLALSIIDRSSLCGRCAALNPLVRQALSLGAKRVADNPHGKRYARWRATGKGPR